MNDMSNQPAEPTVYDYRIAVLDMMVKLRPMLEPAFKHSIEGHTFNDAFNLVATGRGMFFWNDNSCAVLEWREYPAGKTIHVLWAGGKYSDLLELYKVVESLAIKVGCTIMTTLGRKGFERRLPKEGWEIAGIHFYKKLKEN
jgi:hypothetical protein